MGPTTTVINKCDLCLVEWDPRLQNHRRGPDCTAGLKGLIDSAYEHIRLLERALSQMSRTEHDKEDATVHAFSDIRQMVEKLEGRHETLAKRVNLLEHPKLANVPSMGGAGKKKP